MATNSLIKTFVSTGPVGPTGASTDGVSVANVHTYLLSADATLESGNAQFDVSSSYRAININLDTTSFNGNGVDIVLSAFSGYAATEYNIAIYTTNTGVDLTGTVTIGYNPAPSSILTVYPTLFQTTGSLNTYHIRLMLFTDIIILGKMFTLPGDDVPFA